MPARSDAPVLPRTRRSARRRGSSPRPSAAIGARRRSRRRPAGVRNPSTPSSIVEASPKSNPDRSACSATAASSSHRHVAASRPNTVRSGATSGRSSWSHRSAVWRDCSTGQGTGVVGASRRKTTPGLRIVHEVRRRDRLGAEPRCRQGNAVGEQERRFIGPARRGFGICGGGRRRHGQAAGSPAWLGSVVRPAVPWRARTRACSVAEDLDARAHLDQALVQVLVPRAMMSTLRSTEVPLAASIASRMHTAGAAPRADHLGARPARRPVDQHAVRVQQPDVGAQAGQVREVDRPVVVDPVGMSVEPSAVAAITAKNGRLSILRPGTASVDLVDRRLEDTARSGCRPAGCARCRRGTPPTAGSAAPSRRGSPARSPGSRSARGGR